jgi:hypothetical protein
MGRWVALVLAGLGGALLSSCEGDDAHDAPSCVPGQQISCACAVGEGVQVCKSDGSGYGACAGCTDNGGWPSVDGGGGSDGQAGGSGGTSGSAGGTGGVAGADAGPPDVVSHSWIWHDYGGPAYLPAPCSAAAGVADGTLVDPQAFFASLVAGKDPNDWVQVLNEIENQLWACGLGQQRDSSGNVRGRLFLPHAGCPDASPPAGDAKAIFLGVRQEPPCWEKIVDVVGNNYE